MLDFGYYNIDCMEGMREFPDNYFELAIVDPPYGGVTLGILDTHVGSASSLIACKEMGFDYVGFEVSKSYYELSSQRLSVVEAQMTISDLLNDWRFP